MAREERAGAADVPTASLSARVFSRSLIAALSPAPGDALASQSFSVGFNLRALKAAAAAVRERLSQEHWNLIERTEASFARDLRRPVHRRGVLHRRGHRGAAESPANCSRPSPVRKPTA